MSGREWSSSRAGARTRCLALLTRSAHTTGTITWCGRVLRALVVGSCASLPPAAFCQTPSPPPALLPLVLDHPLTATMPAPSKTRQTATRTTKSTSTKSKMAHNVSPDDLADNLANKLTISDPKGKAKAINSESNSHDRQAAAMRAVNASSKSLSAVVESGWRASQSKTSDRTTAASATKAATSARRDLTTLRALAPGNVDIERAASSLVAKLIALEMVRLCPSFLSLFPYPISSIMLHSASSKICIPR